MAGGVKGRKPAGHAGHQWTRGVLLPAGACAVMPRCCRTGSHTVSQSHASRVVIPFRAVEPTQPDCTAFWAVSRKNSAASSASGLDRDGNGTAAAPAEVTVIASQRYSLMLMITAERCPTASCSAAKTGGLNRPAHPGGLRISLSQDRAAASAVADLAVKPRVIRGVRRARLARGRGMPVPGAITSDDS